MLVTIYSYSLFLQLPRLSESYLLSRSIPLQHFSRFHVFNIEGCSTHWTRWRLFFMRCSIVKNTCPTVHMATETYTASYWGPQTYRAFRLSSASYNLKRISIILILWVVQSLFVISSLY